jgi:hypothetical protein
MQTTEEDFIIEASEQTPDNGLLLAAAIESLRAARPSVASASPTAVQDWLTALNVHEPQTPSFSTAFADIVAHEPDLFDTLLQLERGYADILADVRREHQQELLAAKAHIESTLRSSRNDTHLLAEAGEDEEMRRVSHVKSYNYLTRVRSRGVRTLTRCKRPSSVTLSQRFTMSFWKRGGGHKALIASLLLATILRI